MPPPQSDIMAATEKQERRRIVKRSLVFVILLAATLQAAGVRMIGIDVLAKHGLPPTLMPSLLKQVKDKTGMDSYPLGLQIRDRTGKPVVAQEFTLKWQGGSEQVTTDGAGIVNISVTKKNYMGLSLVVPAGHTAIKKKGR